MQSNNDTNTKGAARQYQTAENSDENAPIFWFRIFRHAVICLSHSIFLSDGKVFENFQSS